MNKVWLLMLWCFLSCTLQACFCCKERDDYEERSQKQSSCGAKKQILPVEQAMSLATYDLETVSLEGTESSTIAFEEVTPTLPQGLALQRRRASIQCAGGTKSPYRYMELTKDRFARRPSIMVPLMIDKDHPFYTAILNEYRQAIEREDFDYKDAGAALAFINNLMNVYGMETVPLPGSIEDGTIRSVFNATRQLFPHEPFSFANAEMYRSFLQASLNYARQAGINLPEDYVIAKNFLEHIIKEQQGASKSEAESKRVG